MQYYSVIPIVKLPIKKSPCFTYASTPKIPFGSLVEIDFNHKKLKGIVQNSTKKPFFTTKLITKVIQSSLLKEQQLKLAQKISDYYYTSLGVTLKFFLPPIKGQKINNLFLPNTTIIKKDNKTTLTDRQKTAVESIYCANHEQPFLLFGPASSGKTEIIMALIEKNLKKKVQTVIFIPEIFLAYQEIHRYSQRFGEDQVTVIHSGLKARDYSAAYENIKSGSAKVIIATRRGVFLPFNKLGLIVIDEEQDLSHKQWDQNPRYHLRVVSRFLSQIYKAQVLFCSATPSLETYNSTNSSNLAKLPMLELNDTQVKQPQITIVDLKKYYFKNRNRPIIISDEFRYALDQNLVQKKLALVLVARRGKSKAVICQDCKKVLRCQNCDSQLISVSDEYRCLHCSFRISGFSQCPKCHSFRLKNIGFGTEKVADVLNTIFPSARIEIADQTAFIKESQRAELYAKLQNNKIDILIGSSMIIKGFDLPQVSLVGVLNATDWSGQSDFRFDERWLSNLFQLAGRTNRPGSDQNGQLIIQTFEPQQPALKFLINWDWQGFMDYELTVRQALGYPPFHILIRLTLKDESEEKLEKNSKKMYNKILKKQLSAIITIIPPYYGFFKKIRNNYFQHILMKVDHLDDPSLQTLLQELANEWIIDIDPESIF